MEGPVYPTQLKAQDLDFRIPEEKDRQRINSVIFDELVKSQIQDRSRKEFVSIIERLKARGCDAVVLGCTEIPLLISPTDSPLPTLDSTRLLARAALERALSK